MVKLNKLIKINCLLIISFFIFETNGYTVEKNYNQQNAHPAIENQQIQSNQPHTFSRPNVVHTQRPVTNNMRNTIPYSTTANHNQRATTFNNQQGNQNFHQNHSHHNNQSWNNAGYYGPFDDLYYTVIASPYYYPSEDSSYSVSNDAATNTNSDTTGSESDNTTQLPSGEWVPANNGDMPNNAIAYQDQNGNSGYYCRAMYNNKLYYGELIPNDGCYANDQSVTIHFSDYEVLVTPPDGSEPS